MFGIGKGKLFREGAQIQGVVTERNGPRFTTDGGRANPYHVQVRVKFDDGSTAEIKRKLDRREVGIQSPGAILPLRYDPADRSNIEIDVPAIQRPREAKAAADKTRTELATEEVIAQAEQQISGGGAFPDARAGDAVPMGGRLPTVAEIKEMARTGRTPEATGWTAPNSGSGGAPSLGAVEALEKLASLRERGVLTEAEFAAEKAKILGGS